MGNLKWTKLEESYTIHVMPPSHLQFETCANYTLPSWGLEKSACVHSVILVRSIEARSRSYQLV
jgi:hypothetical protein